MFQTEFVDFDFYHIACSLHYFKYKIGMSMKVVVLLSDKLLPLGQLAIIEVKEYGQCSSLASNALPDH
jgi:hypothetical protein